MRDHWLRTIGTPWETGLLRTSLSIVVLALLLVTPSLQWRLPASARPHFTSDPGANGRAMPNPSLPVKSHKPSSSLVSFHFKLKFNPAAFLSFLMIRVCL